MQYTGAMNMQRAVTFRLLSEQYDEFVDACEAIGFTQSEGLRMAIRRFVDDIERDTRLDFINSVMSALGERKADELGSWLTIFANWFMHSFESHAQAQHFNDMPRAMKQKLILSALDDFLALPGEEREAQVVKFESDTDFELDRTKLAEAPVGTGRRTEK